MRYRIDTERADLFDVNIVITMKVNLDRDADPSEMKAAFDKACTFHEVLQSKVIIEPSGEAYYVDNSVQRNTFSQTELTLEELIRNNERKRFRIEEGEFIRAFYSPEGLIFMMHHLGGDGKSLLYFIETFMKCLAGMQCEKLPLKKLSVDNLPGKGKIPIFYSLLVRIWNGKWSKCRRVFDFGDMDAAYTDFWSRHRTKVEIIKYNKDELDSLLKSSKDAGSSLTAYLIADMIKDSPKKMDVGLAVDGRTDGNRSMGNQATGISVKYRYARNKKIGENAQNIHSLMRKKLSDAGYRFFVLAFMGRLDPTLKDALNMEYSGYFSNIVSKRVAGLLGYGKVAKDLSITNLTRADIPVSYRGYSIREITFIPPVVSYARNVIGIITVGEVMNIARHVYDE